jgi:hypothetical protein
MPNLTLPKPGTLTDMRCARLLLRLSRAALLVLPLVITVSTFTARAQVTTKPASSNPDLSVNALLLYQNSNRGGGDTSADPNGFFLQEAEIQFFSDVDPYHKLTALFSVHQDGKEWKIEPEEVFAETTELPYVTVRAGKFKAAFGKHNLLHTHAFPFIDAPLINTTFLGPDSLNDVGLSAAVLIPLPWFSEVSLQALRGHVEGNPGFNTGSANDLLSVAHLKNLWDVSENLTAEFGLSGALGKNQLDQGADNSKGTTDILGADLTFKWRPTVGGKYHAIIWTTEYMNRTLRRPLDTTSQGQGYASWVQYQFGERWWIEGRAEYLKASDTDAAEPLKLPVNQRKYTALIGFFPSEFSGYRLQYSYLNDGAEKPDHAVMLQANFTIGAHPAHAY